MRAFAQSRIIRTLTKEAHKSAKKTTVKIARNLRDQVDNRSTKIMEKIKLS
jgi:hypothetical protein